MVQLARVHWLGIIDPFLDLGGPSRGSRKVIFMSKYSPSVALNSPESGLLASEKVIIWPKMTRSGLKYQITLHLGGNHRQNAFLDYENGILRLSRVPKGLDLLKK